MQDPISEPLNLYPNVDTMLLRSGTKDMLSMSESGLRQPAAWIHHPALFYLILLINILFVFLTRFYPTIDGPAHLHNAGLLARMVAGDEILGQFYIINTRPVSNWPSHILLGVFTQVFPGWLAEKLFITMYIAGMAFSFRYLIRIANPRMTGASLIVFPFTYSFLFYNGFFNFNISFILLFFTLALFLRSYKICRFPLPMLLLLLTLTALTNVLVFAVASVALGSLILAGSLKEWRSGQYNRNILTITVKELGMLLLASLPGIFLVASFITQTSFAGGEIIRMSSGEMLKWIVDSRPFIVFNYGKEQWITRLYTLCIVLLIVFSNFTMHGTRAREEIIRRLYHFLLLPIAMVLAMYLLTPDSSGAGMMSSRYVLILFMIILVWLALQLRNTLWTRSIIGVFLALHLLLLLQHHGTIRQLSRQAKLIEGAAEHLKPHSVVLSINLSNHWVLTHFSGYAAIDKPVILLNNYQVFMEWFPLKWNRDRMPQLALFTDDETTYSQWEGKEHTDRSRQLIDAVLIYGNHEAAMTADYLAFRKRLDDSFDLFYNPEGGNVQLFVRKVDFP
jgi:hypothetical protein